MRDQLETLMSEATTRLSVQWEEPGAIRRRASRRKVRRRAAVALVSLAALGMGGGTMFAPAGPPPCATAPRMPGPVDRGPDVLVAVSPPRVRVYHGAIGVAENVATELRDRGFLVMEVGRTDESMSYHSAVIRYGPDAVEDARLVEAQLVPWEVYMEFDPARTGPVDLVLGGRFQLNEVCQE